MTKWLKYGIVTALNFNIKYMARSPEAMGTIQKVAREARELFNRVTKPHQDAAKDARERAKAEAAIREASVKAAREGIAAMNSGNTGPLGDMTKEEINEHVEGHLSEEKHPVEEAFDRMKSGKEAKPYTEDQKKAASEKTALELEAEVSRFETGESGERDDEMTKRIDKELKEIQNKHS